MKNYYVVIIAFLVFLFSSCQKDSNQNIISSSCSYAPFSIGSTFTYSYTDSNTTSMVEVIGDTVINNQTYTSLRNIALYNGLTILSSTLYHHCDNGIYSYLNFSGTVGTTSLQTTKAIYLKDNISIGDVWLDTISHSSSLPWNGTVINVTTTSYNKHKYLEKRPSVTLNNGNIFNNVKLIENTKHNISTYNMFFPPSSSITIDTFYYADNIGIIKNPNSELLSYNIN